MDQQSDSIKSVCALTASPRSKGTSQDTHLAPSRDVNTSSNPQSTGVPTLDYEHPSGLGLNSQPTQGNGHPGNGDNKSYPSVRGNERPGSKGECCPSAQGHGSQGSHSQGSLSADCKKKRSDNSDSNSDSEFAIYNTGCVTIIINSVLCYIASKKLWPRVNICDQILKIFNAEDIAHAHNLVLKINESRAVRRSTRDTKSMAYNTVSCMVESCLHNKQLIFATTAIDITPNSGSPTARKISPLVKIFAKSKNQNNDQSEEKQDNEIAAKLDLLIDMFADQQSKIDQLSNSQHGKTDGEANNSNNSNNSYNTPKPEATSSYQDFPFLSPSQTTTKKVDPSPPISLASPPQASNKPPVTPLPDLADESSDASSESETQEEITSNVASKLRGKSNSFKKNKKEKPVNLNNGRSDDMEQHPVPVPEPTTSPNITQTTTVTTPPVTINYATIVKRNITKTPAQASCADDDKHSSTKNSNKEIDAAPKPLQGVTKIQPIFLFITSCVINTENKDIEFFIKQNFNVSGVKARKCAMTHNNYSSFTVKIWGNGIIPETFTKSQKFPPNVKVFKNKNRYPSV